MIRPAGSMVHEPGYRGQPLAGMPAAAIKQARAVLPPDLRAIASENGFDLLYHKPVVFPASTARRHPGTGTASRHPVTTRATPDSTEFLYWDFRPSGRPESTASKEWVTAVNYCACIFSEYERFEKKLRKLRNECHGQVSVIIPVYNTVFKECLTLCPPKADSKKI